MGDGDGNWGHYLGCGLQILVGVLLGVFIGRWIDARMSNANPWATIIGAMLGLSAGMYLLIKDALRMNK